MDRDPPLVRRISNGILEAITGLIQAAKRRARGYRNPDNLITIIYLIAGEARLRPPETRFRLYPHRMTKRRFSEEEALRIGMAFGMPSGSMGQWSNTIANQYIDDASEWVEDGHPEGIKVDRSWDAGRPTNGAAGMWRGAMRVAWSG